MTMTAVRNIAIIVGSLTAWGVGFAIIARQRDRRASSRRRGDWYSLGPLEMTPERRAVIDELRSR